MSYSDKTYGRNVVKNSKYSVYKRRLVMSWVICFLIGFVIGCILIWGIAQASSNVVYAEVAPKTIREPELTPTPVSKSLGEFKLTAYCACYKCCDKHPGDDGYGITKSGVKAVEGVTIAADPSVIPLGTKVTIDGHEYIVQDTGGAIKGNRIDVYFESHQEALEFGVQNKEVFMKEGENYDEM